MLFWKALAGYSLRFDGNHISPSPSFLKGKLWMLPGLADCTWSIFFASEVSPNDVLMGSFVLLYERTVGGVTWLCEALHKEDISYPSSRRILYTFLILAAFEKRSSYRKKIWMYVFIHFHFYQSNIYVILYIY